MNKPDKKPEPHTEKSTMTEPQEEFIEQQSVPSRPKSPSESAPKPEPQKKNKEKGKRK